MSDREPEQHRAEILARRARMRAETARLLPEQRLCRGQVFGELQRGKMTDLREGMLLEVVGGRWRYDRVIEMVGAKPGARSRLTVRFAREGFTVRWDTRVSYRLPAGPPEAECSDCGAPFYRGATEEGQTELCPACSSYARASEA